MDNLLVIKQFKETTFLEVHVSGKNTELVSRIRRISGECLHNIRSKEVALETTLPGNLVQTLNIQILLLQHMAKELASLPKTSRGKRIRRRERVIKENLAGLLCLLGRRRTQPSHRLIRKSSREIVLNKTNVSILVKRKPLTLKRSLYTRKKILDGIVRRKLCGRGFRQQLRVLKETMHRFAGPVNNPISLKPVHNRRNFLLKCLPHRGGPTALNRSSIKNPDKTSTRARGKPRLAQRAHSRKLGLGNGHTGNLVVQFAVGNPQTDARQRRLANLPNVSAKGNPEAATVCSDIDALAKEIHTVTVCTGRFKHLGSINTATQSPAPFTRDGSSQRIVASVCQHPCSKVSPARSTHRTNAGACAKRSIR